MSGSGEGAPELHEHFIPVRKTARVVTLGGRRDGSSTPAAPEELWVCCHGYRQLAARFIRRFRGIASPDRQVVAPEGLSRFYLESDGGRHGPESRVGATWMTREDRDHEIGDYVGYLDEVVHTLAPERGRTVAFGFSQGVHTACRWALYGQTPVDRLILWGAYLPQDLDLERYADRWRAMEVVQVHGEEDPTRSERLAEDQRSRLATEGCAIEIIMHPGGHVVEAMTLARLASSWPEPSGPEA